MGLFGISGIRGVANRDLSPEMALQIGKAVGRTFGGRIALATDPRDSADMFRSALSAGIMSVGSDIVDLGVLPTPALQYYVKTHDDVTGGVSITASHNAPEYNGFKLIHADGMEATREDDKAIENFCARDIETVDPWETGGYSRADGIEDYVNAVISHVDSEAIAKAGLTVVVDCANGATCPTTPLLLRKLKVRAITINGDPQGESPGRPIEPTEESLFNLIGMTTIVGADLGAAHDGDGDRTVFISEKGGFIQGDKSLALMAKVMLEERKGKVITPISSSSIVEDIVTANGGILKYTAVGSHTVVHKMVENKAIFGGEENGGMVFPEMQYCRDGAMTLAKMLECIAKNGPISKQIESFDTYHTVKLRVVCPDARKAELLDHFMQGVEDETSVSTIDGLKIMFDDGWVLLRPSTTEDYFRIYSESKDGRIAEERAEKYMVEAEAFLSGRIST